ncbi:Os11g0105350 [Oryza sativa Japonica Group]|uniref:Os11g0105350 protein n=1 Tax=Oryza sativa subsp. japonica TaxID=39947 RepID=A0A0N7KSA9_ORYSJ|nr:hypothetical protein EE612_053077 [Oryza sativa]BAT12306.1 Os11g0105350 [Oryza sativa Japonica Group]
MFDLGVMHTRPVIMPCTAPTTDGLPRTATSQQTQATMLVVAQMCVLSTATDESVLAEKGSPPLKPVHPIHRMPAPATITTRLPPLAVAISSSSSSFLLGPTQYAAV